MKKALLQYSQLMSKSRPAMWKLDHLAGKVEAVGERVELVLFVGDLFGLGLLFHVASLVAHAC